MGSWQQSVALRMLSSCWNKELDSPLQNVGHAANNFWILDFVSCSESPIIALGFYKLIILWLLNISFYFKWSNLSGRAEPSICNSVSIQYSNLAGAVKWCSQLALWATLWQVETFGDTLHAAMTMQCMVLTDAYCGQWTWTLSEYLEITYYLALGNSTSRKHILTQDLQL